MSSFKGNLYIGHMQPDGTFAAYGQGFNVTVLTIEPKSEAVPRLGTGLHNDGQILDSFSKPSPTSIKIGHNSVDTQQGLELALRGKTKPNVIEAQMLDDQKINLVEGQWVKMDNHIKLTNFVLKKSDDTDYTVNEDYQVDLDFGMIKALKGKINPLTNVTWSAETEAVTTDLIEVGADSEIKGCLGFFGLDKATLKKVRIIVPMCTIASDGGLEMFGDDHIVAAHTVTPETYNGKTMTFETW